MIGNHRARFSHAPGLMYLNAKRGKPLDKELRTGGASDQNSAESGNACSMRLHVVQNAQPNGRYADAEGHSVLIQQPRETCSIEIATREDERRSHHGHSGG